MSFPPMNELLAFQKVASRLSFKKASDELNLAPSTLSHLVRSLEDRLKTRLFNRTTRSVSLTDTGQNLFDELATIFESLEHVLSGVDAKVGAPHGIVRLSVNETAAPIVLSRLNARFYERYPDIRVEILVDNRLIDIVAEGVDAGVRLRDDIPKDMIAVPIIEDFRFIMVASPDYVQKHGVPKAPDDLKGHNCIGFRFQSNRLYAWEFVNQGITRSMEVTGSLITNNPRLLIDAAVDGIGIAYVAEPLVKNALGANKLVRVLDGWERDWPGLYLYYPMNRHMAPALRACVDALKDMKSKPL